MGLAAILFAASTMGGHGIVLEQKLYRHFVSEADLIIQGEVVDKAFRSSSGADGEEAREGSRLPHTFVTIAIEQTLKGLSENPESLTIRYSGGISQDGEAIMATSGTPMLDVGDRGVFFVRRAPESRHPHPQPLVGLKQGFTRFLEENQVMNEMGYELILTDDPVFAARIHPDDVRDYEVLAQHLREPDNAAEEKLLSRLSEAAHQIIREPESASQLPPEALTFRLSGPQAQRLMETMEDSEHSLRELLQRLMPQKFRAISGSIAEAILYRDLNHALFNRELFMPKDLQEVSLRPETKELVEQDPNEMPIGQVLKRNRRVIEDLFPNLVVRSFDRSPVLGRYRPIEAMMTTRIGEHEVRMKRLPVPEGEGEAPEPEELPKGKVLGQEAFLEHLKAMIKIAISREGQKEESNPVVGFDPDEPFTVSPPKPSAPPRSLSLPAREPRNDREAAEFEALQESEGNPVVDRP